MGPKVRFSSHHEEVADWNYPPPHRTGQDTTDLGFAHLISYVQGEPAQIRKYANTQIGGGEENTRAKKKKYVNSKYIDIYKYKDKSVQRL